MWSLFKQDVQRWVIPQQVAAPEAITLGRTLRLLWQHMPLRAMFLYRLGVWCRQKNIPGLPGILQRMIYFFFGLELSVSQDIGGGLYIAHPVGTVISVNRMGRNCTVIHAVTVGMRNEWDFPTIDDGVFIGAGARVLGGIHIGAGAVIGANAVVLDDVPSGATVVGIPAKVVRSRKQNSTDTVNQEEGVPV